jgi:hypothetical protein
VTDFSKVDTVYLKFGTVHTDFDTVHLKFSIKVSIFFTPPNF